MRQEILEVNGIKYPLSIHIEDREKAKVSISRKSIHIKVPRSLTREEIFRQIIEMKQWARKKLLENPEKFSSFISKEYRNGDVLRVGADEYVLHIDFKPKSGSSAKITGNDIFLVISSNLPEEEKSRHISVLLSRCVAKNKYPEMQKRIRALNEKHFSQNIKGIFFKYNQSNWGSCSKDGNVNISTRSLFAPDGVIDYVCIHELAHLIEQNHSERFWSLVERAMPDYRDKKKWLRENGDKCAF